MVQRGHGHPRLREHITIVTTLMRVSRDWPGFKHRLDQSHPKPDSQFPMGFADDYED